MCALAAIACATSTSGAQSPLLVQGTVTRETLDGTRVVARELVTLHRVNARDAGAVDSVLTDARGAFNFRVSVPDSLSMYLVSARYGGIAYFSSPMPGGQSVGPSQIIVYDTTSTDVRVQLQGRHVVVSSPNAAGVRSVIDVLEIENDTILTRVPGPDNRPTYSLLLPAGVDKVHTSQGEVSDKALEVRNGRAELFAPLSPGLRQVVLTYEVAARAFPLAVPLEHAVPVLEVLLEEPGASASSPGLVNKGAVTVDGKTFTRFLGASATDNAVVTIIGAAGTGGMTVPPWLLPLVLTVITLGAILVLARRRSPRPTVVVHERGARLLAFAEPVDGRTTESPRAGLLTSVGSSVDDPVTRLAKQVAAVDAVLARDGAAVASRTETRDPARADAPGLTPDHPLKDGAAIADRVATGDGSDCMSRDELIAYRARLKRELVDALAQRTPSR
ncbi:MAG: hypothetical protein ABI910_00115 [Gemmatimonadota bacterium]